MSEGGSSSCARDGSFSLAPKDKSQYMFTSRGKYLFLCATAICFALCEVGHYIQTYTHKPIFFSIFYSFFLFLLCSLLSAYAAVILILFAMHIKVFCVAKRRTEPRVHKSLLRLIFPSTVCIVLVVWLLTDSILMGTRLVPKCLHEYH